MINVRGFYGVVDVAGVAPDANQAAELAQKLVLGGASVVQLRAKEAHAGSFLTLAQVVAGVCALAGVPFVINDRVDVALAVGAAGVHLGQDDLPYNVARQLVGPDMTIGVSTHNPDQAFAAMRAGADYLGFGPVFATSTKKNPDPVQGVAGLQAAMRRVGDIPVVAIGGVTLDCVPSVVRAGASAACVIAAVNGASDIVRAARDVASCFPNNLRASSDSLTS